jgi:putative intracellular protease/amidase
MSARNAARRRIVPVLISLAVLALLVRFGLPALVHGLGLHPVTERRSFELAGRRALIVATNQDVLGDTGKPTGVASSELTAPYYEFLDAGMEVDLASVRGGRIPVDPQTLLWFIRAPYDDRALADPTLQEKIASSKRVGDLDFTRYDVVFLAGGWGAAYDLGYSDELGRGISAAHAAGKVVGGVCHGPLGLLRAHAPDGRALVEGRRLTAVTDKQVHELGIDVTPQHPETELRRAGAKFESQTAFRDFFASHVVVDGNLVTGQNQNSGAETAQKMMEQLAARAPRAG